MTQIYDFDAGTPPRVTEAQLRERLERRRLRAQMAVLVLAGVAWQVGILHVGRVALAWDVALSAACFGYTALAAVVCGIAVVVYSRRSRDSRSWGGAGGAGGASVAGSVGAAHGVGNAHNAGGLRNSQKGGQHA